MNIKRSYLQGLLAAVGVGLLLTTNCTIKESDGNDGCKKGHKEAGCKCSDGSVAYQVCDSEGVYGKCVCDGSSIDDTCDEGHKKSGCSCDGNVVGYQVCDADGVYGACVCPAGGTGGTGGTGNDTGGTGNDAGGAGNDTAGSGNASNGGTSNAGAPNDGEGGSDGGDLSDIDPDDCYSCLQELCPTELSDCLNDPQCISTDTDGSGQYERISACIERERVNGLVKRDLVRGCGVTIGTSSDASLAADWFPEGMAPTTTNLMNCLATSSTEAPNADWANDPDNYPVVDEMVVPTPWPTKSCAKISCTSKLD
jgi:hypothetical protein